MISQSQGVSTMVWKSSGKNLACPFFIPTERADDIAFPHPARLPLGASWRGTCSAAGHEQSTLDGKELESCNLGYAKSCVRLPKDRSCDAVRFVVVNDSEKVVALQFVLESEYLPAGQGVLTFDKHSGSWALQHSDDRIQKKAECFLQSYLARRNQQHHFID
jgi:hypothetical protein